MTTPNRRSFLTTSAAALGGLALLPDARGADGTPTEYHVYFGTNSGGKSKGIYHSLFNTKTGALTEPTLAAEVKSPSFLAIHPTNRFLYSVGEVDMINGKKAGGLHAFKIDGKTGKLTKINDTDSGGPGPCHVSVDKAGKCVIFANYGGGSSGSVPLNADGSLGKNGSFFQHKGSSVNKSRQEGPHAHSANVSPDNRFAIIADLGLDQLLVYKLDAEHGTMKPNDPPYFATAPGAGPRHFAFHPNGKFAYTNGEMDFTVTAMLYDADRGRFEKIGVVSTIPSDTPQSVRQKNSTAEVLVHPSGKYVFCSNRGHNSIATFKVNPETGALTVGPHLTGDINIPRNFNIDPTGRWILVANQDGDSVVVFEWDNFGGNGKQTGTKVNVGKPVCIKFAPVM